MKVVIVDDEMIERRAMRKFIEESMAGFEVAGEAANGRLAVELASKLRPDLMLMDIKMPGMDGLEAIRKIRVSEPEIRFIMVSAYDSFDYAKEAMKEGVKEYILKPGKKEETIEALFRIKKEILGERSASLEKEEAVQLVKKHLAERLSHRNPAPAEVDRFHQLFPGIRGGFFLILSGCSPKEAEPVLGRHSPVPYICTQQNGNRMSYLFLASEEEESGLRTAALRLARSMTLSIQGSRAGVGYPVLSLKKLWKSYQEAFAAWESIEPGADVPYRFYHESEEGEAQSLAEKLRPLIFSGKTEEALLLFDRSQVEIEALKEGLAAVKYELEKQGIDVQRVPLMNAGNQEELREILYTFCEKVQWAAGEKEVAVKARQYIQANFTEPITLEEVAGQTNLSPTYFTKIFKEQTGQTFIDCVTELRMKRAKELLAGRDLSLKEIAYAVGYRDPSYFSRVFRKTAGQTPKQFRKHIIKKS
ncbi:response regulator transcription factor [Metabacillus sp. 84]|uniref:response regulator transcription factor n=1 Tax=unclassified Metabacillus TaxID=2675274 RepID=UPI003CE8EA64